MALRLGIDSKLFDAIAAHVDSVKAAERNPEQSSESIPLNLSEIYESSRADPLLIRMSMYTVPQPSSYIVLLL